MAIPLTERQQRVLTAIQDWIREFSYPPTIRELGKRLGIKSLRGVTTHLDTLQKKGYLTRGRGAKSIRLLLGGHPGMALRIPILGRIAAGQPLLAEPQLDGHLPLDPSLLGGAPAASEGHFALRVKGESMTGAGILDGDFVIVRQQPSIENGQIAAVLVGEEATVKRVFKEAGQVRLQPEHPTMPPIIVPEGHALTILGQVVAVFRQLV